MTYTKRAMKARLAFLILALPLLAFAQPAIAQPAPFLAAGSGTNLALTQVLLDAWARPQGLQMELPPSIGSQGAIRATLEGKLDLGLISRPLKDDERKAGLVEVVYARVGIVLAAHADVPDTNLDAPDLVDIYRGTKNTWSNGKTIYVLSREAGDSSNLVLEARVPGFSQALRESLAAGRWAVYYTDQAENQALLDTRGSLGITDTASMVTLGPTVKALRFQGVAPSLENLERGRYPLVKELRFVYRPPLRAAPRDFLLFVASEQGRALMRSAGASPPGP